MTVIIILVVVLCIVSTHFLMQARSNNSAKDIYDCSADGHFISRSFVDKSTNRGTDREIDRSYFVYKYEFECDHKKYIVERHTSYGIRDYETVRVCWPSGRPDRAIVDSSGEAHPGQIVIGVVAILFMFAMWLIDSGVLYQFLHINGN